MQIRYPSLPPSLPSRPLSRRKLINCERERGWATLSFSKTEGGRERERRRILAFLRPPFYDGLTAVSARPLIRRLKRPSHARAQTERNDPKSRVASFCSVPLSSHSADRGGVMKKKKNEKRAMGNSTFFSLVFHPSNFNRSP